MMFLRRFVVLLVLVGSAFYARGQNEDCEATLSRAAEEFNAGHFYAIPSILDPCLPQFSREQRQRAYLLLTQAYLLLDDPIGARQSYLNILEANPEFVPEAAVHPIDVIYLGKRFTATSIFSWFGKAGANVSMPRVIHDLHAFGEQVNERYFPQTGYQIGGGIDLTLTGEINLRGEMYYSVAAYRHESTGHFNFDSKVLEERQSWFTLPVTVVYGDGVGKYRPYGYLGYAGHLLLGNRTEITISNDKPDVTSDTGEREVSTEASPSLLTRFKRNPFNHSIVVGGGLKVKVGLDFVFVDIRYSIGMRNVVSADNLYGDYGLDPASAEFIDRAEPTMRFSHVDDFYRLDNLSISFGFLRPLYKPRELKRARTRSLMRQMK